LRRRAALVLLTLVCALVAATLVLFVLVQSDSPRRADAIVVLSGDRARLTTGLRLYHAHVAPTLLISRDARPWKAAKALCKQRGIICFHADPYSTEGEAETVERLGRGRNWRRIVVVTSRYHLRRARLLFERCTHRRPQVVAARTTTLDYLKVVPWEWGKLLYQLTIDRSC
jgi:uncharacterized SAM-binding protein YcdF (DUF218 family)